MSEEWREKLAEAVDARQRRRSWAWVFMGLLGLPVIFVSWHDNIYLRLLIGFLFFFSASFLRTLNSLKSKTELLSDAVNASNSAIYGKNWKAQWDAVSILIGALKNPAEDIRQKSLENLRALTGQDFGPDEEKWMEWWLENRPTYLLDKHGKGKDQAK